MPLQTLNQYMNPDPPSAEAFASGLKTGQDFRAGQTRNSLGEMALQEAPAQFAHERATRERESSGWRQEDLMNIRKMVAGHLGALDTSDPEKFIQGAEIILPQLARDLDQAYGDRAIDAVSFLKTAMDDMQDPQKLPKVMGLADTYRTMLAGPQKPLNALQQAQALKAMRDAGEPYREQRSVEDEMRIRAAGRQPRMTTGEAADRATAVEEARIQAKRNRPLTKSEITNLRHPETLAPARMGMTMGEAEDEGYIAVTPSQMQSLNSLKNSRAILDELSTLANKLITAKNAVTANLQGAKLKAGATARTNTDAAAYSDSRQSFIGVLSRTMGGEKGVLTDRDIARIDKILPSFRDTASLKDIKLSILNRLFVAAQDAARQSVFGFPADSSEVRDLLTQAERKIEAGEATDEEILKKAEEGLRKLRETR